MQAAEDREYTHEIDGEVLSLDFANTVGNRPSGKPDERLTGYATLVSWSRKAGAVTGEEADALLKRAEERPEEARAVLAEAIEFREAMFRIITAQSVGSEASEADLEIFNRTLSVALCHLRLVQRGQEFEWQFRGGANRLDTMLWPVARSAAELLTSHDLHRVRECASDTCTWLFVDRSKNHSRRWCDMNDCGNRAKARRHYQRKKAQPA
jgi:predicted RNA-binding Zn ribbon-like protein